MILWQGVGIKNFKIITSKLFCFNFCSLMIEKYDKLFKLSMNAECF